MNANKIFITKQDDEDEMMIRIATGYVIETKKAKGKQGEILGYPFEIILRYALV